MGYQEANLMQVEWSNKGPNLWTVSEFVIPTVQGVATYQIPQQTIMVLNATIGTVASDGTQTEIVITSLSRTEYASYPIKTTQGRPTSYWFDRLIAPTITLWPVPDNVYNLNVWLFSQVQDASVQGAGSFQIPYRWLDAACAGLAWRLARHYAPPELEQLRKQDYEGVPGLHKGAYQIAADQDTEDTSLYLVPALSGYYR